MAKRPRQGQGHRAGARCDHGRDLLLNAREREVLDLMAQGMCNVEITRRLGLSPKTIGNVVSAILSEAADV